MRTTRDLWARYSPIIECVNSRVSDFQVRLESALTPASYDRKLSNAELDIGFVEPHRVLDFEDRGYEVLARTGRRDRIAGVLVVRTDRGVRRAKDLAGKPISFSSPTALASTLVMAELKDRGITATQAELSFVESEESALMNVVVGRTDASGVSRSAWERYRIQQPNDAQLLRVLFQTQDLPGVAVMAHKRVPKAHVKQLATTLVALAQSELGRAALQKARYSEFRHGQGASYDDLWEFLVKYHRMFEIAPKRQP